MKRKKGETKREFRTRARAAKKQIEKLKMVATSIVLGVAQFDFDMDENLLMLAKGLPAKNHSAKRLREIAKGFRFQISELRGIMPLVDKHLRESDVALLQSDAGDVL